MASITIRNLDEQLKAQLRMQAPAMVIPWKKRRVSFGVVP